LQRELRIVDLTRKTGVPFPAMPKLQIQCQNVRNRQGQLIAVAWSKVENFRSEDHRLAAALEHVSIGDKSVSIDLGELPAGTYAVAVLHDENMNQKLDMSPMLGLPTEGMGYSNNPKMGLTGPRWEEASFQLDSDSTVEVRLKYWL
jgi:uncharacterized protein (DUF2141 family)